MILVFQIFTLENMQQKYFYFASCSVPPWLDLVSCKTSILIGAMCYRRQTVIDALISPITL